jgi:hypothetical protein
MLIELETQQHADDYFRRWFNDDIFDLFVWYDAGPRLVGFQLCYDKDRREGALTYLDGRGYTHSTVDSGEDSAWSGESPALRAGGEFPRERVLGAFAARSKEIDAQVRQYVIEKLEAYAQPWSAPPSPARAAGRGDGGRRAFVSSSIL